MTGVMPAWLQVKPGDLIEARLVLELLRQIEERTFTPGMNCRIHVIPGLGSTVEGVMKTVNFPHPWDVALNGSQVSVSVGLVNGIVPYMNGVSMDGLDAKGNPLKTGVPKLMLDQKLYDATGRTWICLQVKIDPATGKLLDLTKGGLSIIQADQLFIGDGGATDQNNTGLWPLALLRRPVTATTGFGTVYDVTYFNLNHRYVAASPAPSGSVPVHARHFFWA